MNTYQKQLISTWILTLAGFICPPIIFLLQKKKIATLISGSLILLSLFLAGIYTRSVMKLGVNVHHFSFTTRQNDA